MSLQSLQKTLDNLALVIEKEVFRGALAKETQEIEYLHKQMYTELQQHYFGSKSGGSANFATQRNDVSTSGKPWLSILDSYVLDAIEALKKAFEADPKIGFAEKPTAKKLVARCLKKNPNAIIVPGGKKADSFEAGVGNPYNRIKDTARDTLNKLTNSTVDYRELFWEGRDYDKMTKEEKNKFTMAKAVNLGHKTSVANYVAGAFEGELPDELGQGYTGTLREGAQDDWKEIEKIYAQYKKDLGTISLGIKQHNPKVSFEGGKPVAELGAHTVYLMGEGTIVNSAGEKSTESMANQVTGPGLTLIRTKIEKFFQKHNYLKMSGSRSAVDKMRDAFLMSPKIRKLAKGSAAQKAKLVKKAPDSPIISSEIGTLVEKGARSKGVAAVKGKGSKSKSKKRGAVASESRNNFLDLQVLLNAKLPQTVAQNMGSPALETEQDALQVVYE